MSFLEESFAELTQLLNLILGSLSGDTDHHPSAVQEHIEEAERTLLNLITNAVHAIEETGRTDGRIRVASRRVGDDVEIVIADTGCGMTDEVKARMFDAFFTTKDVGRGSGQGLSMARAIICQSQGGSIDVDSTQGEGTTVVVRLPVSGPPG